MFILVIEEDTVYLIGNALDYFSPLQRALSSKNRLHMSVVFKYLCQWNDIVEIASVLIWKFTNHSNVTHTHTETHCHTDSSLIVEGMRIKMNIRNAIELIIYWLKNIVHHIFETYWTPVLYQICDVAMEIGNGTQTVVYFFSSFFTT